MTTDLKERFSVADDGLRAPDLWAEASRRATEERPPARGLDGTWAPERHRLVTAAVAFAVFAAAAVFAWDLSHPEPAPVPQPGVDLGSELPTGWSELPPPPENRSGAATAWTGSELLVWGGYEFVGHGDEDPDADGFAFDGPTRTWRALPDGPLEGRSDPASAWTGDELLIWGGFDGGFREDPYFANGAAYDPSTRTWRMLPAAPLSARTPFSVWTGEELIVWGSTDRSDRMRDGAAYDPATDTWRRIAEAPTDITDGSAVWTDEEMIVFGAALDGNNHADTPTAIGAAYDPRANTWRELPPSTLSPQAMTAEWLNGQLIAWDYEHASAVYDPASDRWRELTDVPLAFSECRPVSVATEEVVFGEFCGKTVVFSPEDDAWHRDQIPVADPSDGCCAVLEPLAAGDVVIVTSHSYGKALEAIDRRMFVYNPPAVVRTDPTGEMLEPEPFIPSGGERDGDLIRMPVTFPDGSRATLVYPIPLDLATRGVQPDVSYLWRDNPAPRFPIVFLHDRDASIASFVEQEGPSCLANTDEGGIEVWRARGDDVIHRFWIRLELPSWTVLVSARDAADCGAGVVAHLDLRETATGFPVVETSGPIALAEGFGESGGPQLAIGDATAEPDTVSQLDATIFLSPDGCNGGTEASGTYGSSCLADGSVFASIYGDRDFVSRVIDGLRVEDFRAA
jgi:hypothetical protein